MLNHERVPLDLDLPRFEGRLAGRAEGGVAGHVSFGPGALKVRRRPRAAAGNRDRPRHSPGPPHRPRCEDRRGEDQPRLPRPAPPFRTSAGTVHDRRAARSRPPRAPHLPLRPRSGGDRELERASLGGRLPAAHRGPGKGHRRHLPRHGGAALRDLAVLRWSLGPGDARPRRRGPGRLGPASPGRPAHPDRPPGAHPGTGGGGRRGGRPRDALRLGSDGGRHRRQR